MDEMTFVVNVVGGLLAAILMIVAYYFFRKGQSKKPAPPKTAPVSSDEVLSTDLRRLYRPGYAVVNSILTISSFLVVADIVGAIILAAMLFTMKSPGTAIIMGGVFMVLVLLSAAVITWVVSGFFQWMLRANLDQTILMAERSSTGRRASPLS